MRKKLFKLLFSEEYKALYRDELTGIFNRRYLRENEEKYRAYLFIDVNKFKKYNDTYGHQKGDHVLKEVAMQLKNFSSEPVRYGGDEFVLGFRREVSQDFLRRISSEIKAAVKKTGVEISIGASETINKADELMYQDKRGVSPALA